MIAGEPQRNALVRSSQPLVDLVARVARRFEQQDGGRMVDGALLETIEILLGEAEACPHLRYEPLPLGPTPENSARARPAASMRDGEPDRHPLIFDRATTSLTALICRLLRVAAFRRCDGADTARRVRALFVAAARSAAARSSLPARSDAA